MYPTSIKPWSNNMNDNGFNNIRNSIINLEYYHGEEYIDNGETNKFVQDCINSLLNQFERAASAEWSKDELTTMIFDNDVLDSYDADLHQVCENFHVDIRECQHAIIQFFSVD